MTVPMRKIEFLVDKNEMRLIKEACLYGADADRNLKKAISQNDKYHVEFLYEELDNLAGYISHCANHEKSGRKQDKWDSLSDRVKGLLRLSDRISRHSNQGKKNYTHGKYPPQMMYYTFDIWIGKRGAAIFAGKVLRKIRLPGSKSLYNFAKVITKAFGFYFDHCFGYYDNFERYHDSKKAYELFVDIGEEASSSKIKGVKKTQICQVFQNPAEKMLFLFDYGDCWYFGIELKEINFIDKWNLDPIVLESVGEAPTQYPIHEQDKHLYEDREI